jgi:hypothetical protein
MNMASHRLSASVLMVVGTAALVADQLGRTFAGEASSAAVTTAEFKRLAGELDLKSQPWAKIPWKVSVTEARQLAAKERKPIFLVVNTGNCLGWT